MKMLCFSSCMRENISGTASILVTSHCIKGLLGYNVNPGKAVTVFFKKQHIVRLFVKISSVITLSFCLRKNKQSKNTLERTVRYINLGEFQGKSRADASRPVRLISWRALQMRSFRKSIIACSADTWFHAASSSPRKPSGICSVIA